MSEALTDVYGDEHMKEAEKLLGDLPNLCEKQWMQKDACYELYDRHADFQQQIVFVKKHRPHTDADYNFCREGAKLALRTITEFSNFLQNASRRSKLRSLLNRRKTVRTLKALNQALTQGIERVHTLIPETHALFQPPTTLGLPDTEFQAIEFDPWAYSTAPGPTRARSRKNSAGLLFGKPGARGGVTPPPPVPPVPVVSIPPTQLTVPDSQTPNGLDWSPSYEYALGDNRLPNPPAAA